MMRSIYVEPVKDPRIVQIQHTLTHLQALVGGMIEVVEAFDDQDVVIVCDECGRNDGKSVNRVINDRIDNCGSFFICGYNDSALCSIPEPKLFKYFSMFRIDKNGPTN